MFKLRALQSCRALRGTLLSPHRHTQVSRTTMSGLFPKTTSATATSSSQTSSSSNPSKKKNNSNRKPRMPPLNAPIKTTYTSLPVPIPPTFLTPLPDPSRIKVSRIDFANSPLPEYRSCYAVILDNVLTQEECDQLIRYAEESAGGHHQGKDEEEEDSSSYPPVPPVPDNGWKPALVNVGSGHEILVKDYRNSDRIIWDQGDVTRRIWNRVLQGEGMSEYFGRLEGESYEIVIGRRAVERGERWRDTAQGVNERMRFLRYTPGGYFRPHCDGAYTTPDGSQTSWFTIHLYLNDSAQALGIPEADPSAAAETGSKTDPGLGDVPEIEKQPELLRGGATTFHGHGVDLDGKGGSRLDVDPLAGRVLIFQHRFLEHSGDDVTAGIKYTLRSDIMYEREG